MADPAVLYEVRDYIATITLNRPDNRNSMTEDLLEGVAAAVAQVRQDSEVRCVIITGKGRSFSAGADFRSQVQRGSGERELLPNERSFAMYQPFLSVLSIEVPVIGALNGHAIGGGLGLALVCDVRVANRDAKYGANFVRLGLHPGMATTYFLPRFVGIPRAAELLLTGRLISGAEAAEYGFANYAVAPDEVLPKAQEIAREVAGCAPIAVRWTKRSLYRNVSWDPTPAAEIEAGVQSRTVETEDFREGVAALLEKRDPAFRGR
jgi:enoyl-CoA hydratase/carnithine racemase